MSGCENAEAYPNTQVDFELYIEHLKACPYISEIHLIGSRSKNHPKEIHECSDWDILIISPLPNFKLISPRKTGQLNACVVFAENTDKVKTNELIFRRKEK